MYESGIIIGKCETHNNKRVDVFVGIPYAEPPVGRFRFKRPVPALKWSQPLNATKWPNPCYQLPLLITSMTNTNFSEDCLYLNIWSPNSSQSDDNLKAVMFFIHSGSFLYGTASDRHIDGIALSATGDVVVVTINYRLNAFGFFYTGTDDSPGNMGLFDQSLALEWVNDNIRYFGGDPNRVTVFGESSGAWATSLHIISPINQNLFKNAILMSGAALNYGLVVEPNVALRYWLKHTESIGCCNDNDTCGHKFTAKTIECLRNISPEKLVSLVRTPFDINNSLQVIDENNFNKNINLMVGTKRDEGSPLLAIFIDAVKYHPFSPVNITFNEAFNELKQLSSKWVSKVAINGEDVAKLYFTGLSDRNSQHLLRQTIGIGLGDLFSTCPTIQFAKSFANKTHNKVFQYFYNIKTGKESPHCSQWMDICDTYDNFPVFDLPVLSVVFNGLNITQ
ncbi:unnamed protein product [Medioppia subpectinata]|uniref:Carboxylic ester hydrolase n=1 Tax=Medioppia subpectinata TaxID=1979941 RepID=A0A7R9KW79_9ACAR|nr:unnamed protein product [Medioppia subpectinata]CAG2109839.1 unnamed protein product [Medioppia subpectinata]